MRRFHILIFCFLFVELIAKPCFSEEFKEFAIDGGVWESWDESTKLAWIIGFMEGFHSGTGGIGLFLPRYALKGGIEKLKELTEEKYYELMAEELWGKGTGGELLVGLDEFYKDYRNKEIFVREAICIVRMGLMGAPQEFIQQTIRLRRTPWEKRVKEQEFLLEWNQEYKRAFKKWGHALPFSVSPASLK